MTDAKGPYSPGDIDPVPTIDADSLMQAVERRLWDLAPELYREASHRDITFAVTMQDLLFAVQEGIEDAAGHAVWPEQENPFEDHQEPAMSVSAAHRHQCPWCGRKFFTLWRYSACYERHRVLSRKGS